MVHLETGHDIAIFLEERKFLQENQNKLVLKEIFGSIRRYDLAGKLDMYTAEGKSQQSLFKRFKQQHKQIEKETDHKN